MKAQELRIGNLTEQGQVKTIYERGIHVGFGRCFEFNDLKPIPLTEEWLLKFGYDLITENHYAISGHLIWICNDLFICDKNGIILKHVHQLQNLYFALNREELKL